MRAASPGGCGIRTRSRCTTSSSTPDGRAWSWSTCASESLGALIASRGHLPPDEVAAIGVQVADALAEAHAAGIVHRDVKPDNVLITEDGTAKITDFGVSRAAGDSTVTATGFMAGTPAYLAPEVALGDEADARSDVFSLGATLYAALEGDAAVRRGRERDRDAAQGGRAARSARRRQAGPLAGLRDVVAAPRSRRAPVDARRARRADRRRGGPAAARVPAAARRRWCSRRRGGCRGGPSWPARPRPASWRRGSRWASTSGTSRRPRGATGSTGSTVTTSTTVGAVPGLRGELPGHRLLAGRLRGGGDRPQRR